MGIAGGEDGLGRDYDNVGAGMSSRTRDEIAANRVDCDLARLERTAVERKWDDAARAIQMARTLVRVRMHDNDWRATR